MFLALLRFSDELQIQEVSHSFLRVKIFKGKIPIISSLSYLHLRRELLSRLFHGLKDRTKFSLVVCVAVLLVMT